MTLRIETQTRTTPGRSCSLHVERHDVDESTVRHLSSEYWKWLEAFESDPFATIHQHPGYVISESTTTEGDASFLLRSSNAAGEAAFGAFVPKSLAIRPYPLRREFRGFRLAGPRFVGSATEPLQRALLDEAVRQLVHSRAEFLLIEDIPEQSALWQQLVSRDDVILYSPSGMQERYVLNLPMNAGHYWNEMSSKRRNTYRRKIKKLGGARLVRVTEAGQIAGYLDDAHRVSLNSWQTRRLGLRVANDDREIRLLSFLAEIGALRSYLLYQDDRPIAFLFGHQLNGRYYYEEVGYDQEFAKLSPGLVLLLKVIDDLFQSQTPQRLDFGLGHADYKQQLANHQTRSANVLVFPATVKTRLLVQSFKTCKWIDTTARRILKRTGLSGASAGLCGVA